MGDHGGERPRNEAALRRRLVELYAELSALTEPECATACARPLSCCDALYCELAIEFAREYWGVELVPTWHAALPLMGTTGCTAAPHLRPMCTAHTCGVVACGRKPGDAAWTARYYALRGEIGDVEALLFPGGAI